jgi:hypothetical protein
MATESMHVDLCMLVSPPSELHFNQKRAVSVLSVSYKLLAVDDVAKSDMAQ